MDLKATIDKDAFGYRNRLIIIALGALFYASLCVYDARIKYPEQIDKYALFETTKADNPDDWRDQWRLIAEENGWDAKEPTKRSQGDIATQWWQFAIVFPIGVYCLFNAINWSRRYIAADESKLYAYGNVEVPFDQITRIDATRWDRKGIARVYYDLGAGEKNILIDDFKYERHPADAIFDRIKAHIDADKITGLAEEDVPTEEGSPEENAIPADA